VSKLKKRIENERSCESCYHASEIESRVHIRKVFCKKKNKWVNFLKLCPDYEPLTCLNCRNLIDINYEGRTVKFLGHYTHTHTYYDTWMVYCTEYMYARMKVKTERKAREVKHPSCSLWRPKE